MTACSARDRAWHRAAAARDWPAAESVVAGQSGVGKSSLLNAIEPGLPLRVQSRQRRESQKGKHTTTTAELMPLSMRRLRRRHAGHPPVSALGRDPRGGRRLSSATCGRTSSLCRFPDCTHTHEDDCAVKDAVADGRLDARRYESYCHLFAGDME